MLLSVHVDCVYLKQLMERCIIQRFIWLCEGLRTENVTCDEDCIAPRGIFVIVPLLLVLFKKMSAPCKVYIVKI